MCAPLLPILAGAAALTSATGQVMSGIGQSQQYRAAAAVDRQNAAIANGQARDSIESTNIEALRLGRQHAQREGQAVASMAAGGVDLNFGSAIDVQKDLAMSASEDAAQLYKSGAARTKGFETEAWNYASQAQANKAKASGAMTSAIFGAVSTALGGASQAYKGMPIKSATFG